jgi:hypothetical protein
MTSATLLNGSTTALLFCCFKRDVTNPAIAAAGMTTWSFAVWTRQQGAPQAREGESGRRAAHIKTPPLGFLGECFRIMGVAVT